MRSTVCVYTAKIHFKTYHTVFLLFFASYFWPLDNGRLQKLCTTVVKFESFSRYVALAVSNVHVHT